MSEKIFHTPALLQEVIEYLQIQTGKRYIDATLGGGGHTREILKRGGRVLGIDRDPDAIREIQKLRSEYPHLIVVLGNFQDIAAIARKHHFSHCDGVLFDLGASLFQLTHSERGFSFLSDAPLDMRMNPNEEIPTAGDLINGLYERELYELFQKYGEEKLARPIAHAVYESRRVRKIKTTRELSQIITRVYRKKGVKTRIHPATRVFQALRIVVNDELNTLRNALPQIVDLLEPGARLVVISFHSLEDRIVKKFLREKVKEGVFKEITKKPITPTNEQKQKIVTQRAAKLRVGEKV